MQVKLAAKQLFSECAKKQNKAGNLVFKVLPDIISHLLKDAGMVQQPERFQGIMRELLLHIHLKYHMSLVGTFMDRILHQEWPLVATMLLNSIRLLKGQAACKQVFVRLRQDRHTLRSEFLQDPKFRASLMVRFPVVSLNLHYLARACMYMEKPCLVIDAKSNAGCDEKGIWHLAALRPPR